MCCYYRNSCKSRFAPHAQQIKQPKIAVTGTNDRKLLEYRCHPVDLFKYSFISTFLKMPRWVIMLATAYVDSCPFYYSNSFSSKWLLIRATRGFKIILAWLHSCAAQPAKPHPPALLLSHPPVPPAS